MSEMTPHVLELNNSGNTWIPPEIDMEKAVSEALEAATSGRYLHIMRTDPYIDSVYIEYDPEGKITDIKRFTFHEGYSWDDGEERFFDEYCIKDDACAYSGGSISEIYKRYSAIHPEWHIQRYYTTTYCIIL